MEQVNYLSNTKIIRETVERNGKVFSAFYLEFRNACVLFLSEGADSLGTLSVSIPKRTGIGGLTASSILLGDRNIVAAKLLAERLSDIVGKVALVSVFTRTADDMEASRTFLELMKKVVAKKEEKE